MTTDLFDSLEALDDPTPYAASPALLAGAVARGRQLRRRRRGGLAAGAVPVVLVLALVAGAVYVDRRTNDVARVDIAAGALATPAAGQPYNILLVGTDGGATLSDGSRATARSDTILVVHVDEAGHRLSVLSLPRDLVFAGATSAADRLNEVLPRSGPSGLITTIHDHLGIEISHYIEVDFQGFQKLVDAAGGLSVQASTPMRDANSGMALDGSCQHLDGSQVLGLARSRHVEYERDGQWNTDPTGDLGRMDRERIVLSLLSTRLVRMPDDPGTLDQLINVFADNTIIDSQLSRSTLVDLARWGRTLDPAAVSASTLPVDETMLPDRALVLTPTPQTSEAVAAFQHGDAPVPSGITTRIVSPVSIAGC